MSQLNRSVRQMRRTQKNWIAEALKLEQDVLLGKLKLARESIKHPTTKGGVAEDIWLDFLRRYLPNRYEVSSGFVVDHKGGISQQIDIVIFDRHFTPTLLLQEQHRYIPAEAVYMVFEVKPAFSADHIAYAEEKLASVTKLERTSASMIASGKQTDARRLFEISGGLLALDGWVNKNFQKNIEEYVESLNCGCCLENGAFYNFDSLDFFLESDMALSHFMMKLLAHLNKLGSAPAIDWGKYAGIIQGDSGPQIRSPIAS